MKIKDLHALTPVEFHNGIHFKRDDLFRPFTDIGVSGGKVRQCLLLVRKHLRDIKRTHGGTIATACSVHSPQGVIVARVAKKYGLKCLIGCGTAKPMTHAALRQCKVLGAEIKTLVTSNAYTAVLESRLDRLRKSTEFFPIRFGYQAETDGDAIIEPNAAQVQNIPDQVTALVVPVGSAVSAHGILVGVERYRPNLTVYLIQPFGYSRTLAIPPTVKAHYLTGKYPYSTLMNITIGSFQLDQIYEAKAYHYMQRHLKSILRREVVCFWVIGDANWLRAWAPAGHDRTRSPIQADDSSLKE